MRFGYALMIVTIMLMIWASLAGARELESTKYPPCLFSPLCTCSKASPNDLGIVQCKNVPYPAMPRTVNNSKVRMKTWIVSIKEILINIENSEKSEWLRLLSIFLWTTSFKRTHLKVIAWIFEKLSDITVGLQVFGMIFNLKWTQLFWSVNINVLNRARTQPWPVRIGFGGRSKLRTLVHIDKPDSDRISGPIG